MPALAPLATSDDLDALGIDTAGAPESQVASLLAGVSSAIRDAAGAAISRETSTIATPGVIGAWLDIPLSPVLTVSDVKIDGRAVDDWRLIDGRIWRRDGWFRRGAPVLVQMTVEHGYDPVPADIVNLACMLVASGLSTANGDGFGSSRGVSSERIDDYQISYTRGDDEVVDPTSIPDATRRMLRARFAPSGTVVGTTR